MHFLTCGIAFHADIGAVAQNTDLAAILRLVITRVEGKTDFQVTGSIDTVRVHVHGIGSEPGASFQQWTCIRIEHVTVSAYFVDREGH